jgi:uncharacterized damage-inducible protein DinB
MNVADIRELVDYYYWATRRVLEMLDGITAEQYTKDMGNSFPSIQATAGHLQFAEAVWMGRLRGQTHQGPNPELHETVGALRARWAELEESYRGYVAGLTDEALHKPFLGLGPGGKEYTYTPAVVIQQVTNHGLYHRGQIVTLLRQQGVKPTQTDMILYYRITTGQA